MRRLSAVVAVFAGAILIAVPVSLAATPQQIYRDYADNGKLDGHYSSADLQRAQRSLIVQGYKPTTNKGLKHAVKKANKGNKKNEVKAANKQQGIAPTKKSGGLPFTGLDLALISIGGVSLLAFGASLRRFARRTTN